MLVGLWGYAGITGGSPSVLRAAVMFSLFVLASVSRRRPDHINSLFAAALILVFYDPGLLRQPGFQLSFLAVFGIVVLHGPLERLWLPQSRVLAGIWSLACVSISAQLFTAPVSVLLFGAFPVWFLPANLIVVTAAGFAVYGCVALLVLHAVPFLGHALAWLLGWLLKGISAIAEGVARWPGAYPAIRIDAYDMVALYALLLLLAARWQWRWPGMGRLVLALCAALMLKWGFEARADRKREAFVVYAAAKGVAAAMVSGTGMALVSAGVPPEAAETLVQRHMRAWSVEMVASDSLGGPLVRPLGGGVLADARWRSSAFDILFWDPSVARRAVPVQGYDAIIIHGLRRLSEREAGAMARTAKHVVLAGGVPWGVRRRVAQACALAGTPCHDIRRDGAFILERGR
jgi:competence protein ComEC